MTGLRDGEHRLLTRAGEYVTTVVVPPFNPPADVVLWGNRCFVLKDDGDYREAVSWYSSEPPR